MSTIEQPLIAEPETQAEQTRARYPDSEGYVERDGVRVFYEVYGSGEPTILFLPTWTFVHSRIWKMQIPYFARHHRVVVFDPRGNGKSDRPASVEAYAESEFAQDALDVMDATETDRAVIAGLSRGAQRAPLLAAEHPGRVSGAVFVGPLFRASRLGGLRWRIMARLRPLATRRPPIAKGWGKFNPSHFVRDFRDFVESARARPSRPLSGACDHRHPRPGDEFGRREGARIRNRRPPAGDRGRSHVPEAVERVPPRLACQGRSRGARGAGDLGRLPGRDRGARPSPRRAPGRGRPR